MDKETLKSKIDLANIKEFLFSKGFDTKYDYVYDPVTNNKLAFVSPLEYSIIQYIKNLEKRVEVLEQLLKQ